MKTNITLEHHTLPAFWASYIINNDHSGISEQEKDEIDRFLSTLKGYLTLKDMGSEPWFDGYQDVLEYVEVIHGGSI